MFRQISDTAYGERSGGGVRHLFRLGHFEFHDTLDDDGMIHHFLIESPEDGEEPVIHQTDQPTMYELLARYLAGEHEKKEYEMERSPTHEALLDLLELATARARSGESDFTIEELEEEEEDGEEK